MGVISTIIDKFTEKATAGWSFWDLKIGTGKYTFKTDAQFHSAYSTNPLVFMVVDKQATVVSSFTQLFVNSAGIPQFNTKEQELWENPNSKQVRKDFIYQLMTDLLVNGRASVYGLKPIGFGKYSEFHILPVNCTTVTKNSDKKIIRYDTYIDEVRYKIEGDDVNNVLELRMPSIDGAWKSKSKLSVLGEMVTSSTAILETETYTYQNGGGVKMLTNDSDLPMTQNQKEDAQKDFDTNHTGVAKAGSVRLTNAKLRAIDLTRSPSDLKLDESSMSKLRGIAGVYGLDSKIFGDPKSSTYNNMSEALKAAYLQVFIPLCEDYIIREFNEFWLKANWGSKLLMELDKTNIDEIKSANKEFADTDKVKMETIAVIMAMPITRDGKKSLLISDLDYSDEQADGILNTQNVNSELDKLKSMPAFVAGKIIDRLTDDEIKALLR